MLQAVYRGKAGRVELDGQSLQWREIFKRREDLLTATFFGRLPYLSDNAFNAVLSRLIGTEQTKNLSSFTKMELWPHFTELDERKFVEPDVLLCFEHEIVMVEVKPPFGGKQYLEQWKAQMAALSVEIDYLKYTKIHFVALGNTLNTTLSDTEYPARFTPMTQLEWSDLRSLLQDESLFARNRQDAAVRQDWLKAFELFGMTPIVPDWEPLLKYARGSAGDGAISSGWKSLLNFSMSPNQLSHKSKITF